MDRGTGTHPTVDMLLATGTMLVRCPNKRAPKFARARTLTHTQT